ncbi:MAG: flavodoxin domain-containing protein [Betaproteobacteria bacterium]|nr:flavodoxin domain-containing protein [Betaproteobacteria bacterium]
MSAVLTYPVPHDSPLAPEQREALEALLKSLDGYQLNWLGGYLSGLASAARATPQVAAPAPGEPILVVYASQTGHATGLAERLAAALASRGLRAEARDARHVRVSRLNQYKQLVLVASTHGEGDPPDAARLFYRDLASERAPRLDSVEYAVLALGDQGYEHFCKFGRELDSRLEQLGGKRLLERLDCDVDYEVPAAAWIERAIERLAAGRERAPVLRLAAAARGGSVRAPRAVAAARVERNQRITARDSSKEVRHVELAFEDGELAYEPGDSVSVAPRNDPALVAALLERLGLDPAAQVRVRERSLALGEALESALEVGALARPVIERYAALSEAGALRGLLGEDAREALRAFLRGRDLLDLVEEYPPRGLDAQALADLLRPLQPRSYSIASSRLANPGEAHLTVGVVRYSARARTRHGVASGHLARRAPGARLELRLAPNRNFRLPADPGSAIVMIGAGTGIAPYRAFVEEREARGARGKAWLVFGERNFRSDFLYQSEWLEYRKRGLLTRIDVAFSRDQAAKEYVQHRLLENGRELYRWIEDGAHLYVCGDAARMAPDVEVALARLVAEARGVDREEASAYLQALAEQGRYQRDVY